MAIAAGSVVMPVESAISTRKQTKFASQGGRVRSGLEATLSSSKTMQWAKGGGRALRKLQEISRARRVVVIEGRTVNKNEGIC